MRFSFGSPFTLADVRTFREQLRPTWWSLVAFTAAVALMQLVVGVIRGRVIPPLWMHDVAPPVVIVGMWLVIALLFLGVVFFGDMMRRGLYGYYVQLRKDPHGSLYCHIMDGVSDLVVTDESSLLLHTGGLLRRGSRVFYKYYPDLHSSRPEIKELPLNLRLVERGGGLEIVWRDGRKVMALDPHDAVMLLPLAVPQLIGRVKGQFHMAFMMAICNKMRTAHYGLDDLNNKREYLESRLAITEACLDDALMVGEELSLLLADRKVVPGNYEVAETKRAAAAVLHALAMRTLERYSMGSHRRILAMIFGDHLEVKTVAERKMRITCAAQRSESNLQLSWDKDNVLAEIESLKQGAAQLAAESEKIVPAPTN